MGVYSSSDLAIVSRLARVVARELDNLVTAFRAQPPVWKTLPAATSSICPSPETWPMKERRAVSLLTHTCHVHDEIQARFCDDQGSGGPHTHIIVHRVTIGGDRGVRRVPLPRRRWSGRVPPAHFNNRGRLGPSLYRSGLHALRHHACCGAPVTIRLAGLGNLSGAARCCFLTSQFSERVQSHSNLILEIQP